MIKCDIVICIWNQIELTRDCIESIHKNTKFPYRLILIDNASDNETKTYLENLRNDPRFEVLLIRNEENNGNTKAVNQGLRASNAEFICNLDNDTYVTEGWLTEMVEVAHTDPTIGIVGPAYGGSDPKTHASEDVEEKGAQVSKRKGQILELATIDCFCALMKRDVINKIGYWDEAYSPGYFDDTDYSRRAVNGGYRIVCAKGAYVYHRGSGSFKKKSKMREELFERNREKFEATYGKPNRILYVIDRDDEKLLRKIKENVQTDAAQANWVWLIRKSSMEDLGLISHSHIRQFQYSSFFFNAKAFFRVLTRRKKRFDKVYVSSSVLKDALEIVKPIHKANVIRLQTDHSKR